MLLASGEVDFDDAGEVYSSSARSKSKKFAREINAGKYSKEQKEYLIDYLNKNKNAEISPEHVINRYYKEGYRISDDEHFYKNAKGLENVKSKFKKSGNSDIELKYKKHDLDDLAKERVDVLLERGKG